MRGDSSDTGDSEAAGRTYREHEVPHAAVNDSNVAAAHDRPVTSRQVEFGACACWLTPSMFDRSRIRAGLPC